MTLQEQHSHLSKEKITSPSIHLYCHKILVRQRGSCMEHAQWMHTPLGLGDFNKEFGRLVGSMELFLTLKPPKRNMEKCGILQTNVVFLHFPWNMTHVMLWLLHKFLGCIDRSCLRKNYCTAVLDAVAKSMHTQQHWSLRLLSSFCTKSIEISICVFYCGR